MLINAPKMTHSLYLAYTHCVLLYPLSGLGGFLRDKQFEARENKYSSNNVVLGVCCPQSTE